MSHMLTKREYMFYGEGPTLGVNRRPIAYEVLGLPEGQKAWIADMDHRWQILRATDGVYGDWTGEYHSAHEAMAELVVL